ncbi:hypothetical protein [Fodinicola acaciae]|uniref:hypothetical protein n=1 Tax=Fodinicola acaciae TaxID=2681555 RepID=UPI0013D88325|nr:hypothetical protein [Fodinicola acaciae]
MEISKAGDIPAGVSHVRDRGCHQFDNHRGVLPFHYFEGYRSDGRENADVPRLLR